MLFTLTLPPSLQVYLSTWPVAWPVACAGSAMQSGTESWFCWCATINGTAARPALKGTKGAGAARKRIDSIASKSSDPGESPFGPNPEQLSGRKHDRPLFGLIEL